MASWQLLALILVTPALSSASGTFAVQGRLADAAGLSAPDGSYGLTFSVWTAETTCGRFNGLHSRYVGYSYTSDVDSGDGTGCWYMQMVPNALYGGAAGYLDGYGGQVLDRKWQSMWLR